MKFATALALPLGALLMTGQAFAADAVMMPEPQAEPMNYVRICDVYGAGFFYIPGTETCLRLGGYVRYVIGATSEGPGDTPNEYGFTRDNWTKQVRARLNIDARSETEWGTLRSFIRVQGDYENYAPGVSGIGSDPNVGLDLAFLQLGGFAAGYMQSAFAGTFNGGVSNDGTHSDDGLDYGDQYREAIQYNFGSGDGLFGTVSLENDDIAGAGTGNYVPDIVGKVGYAGDWGTVHTLVGYDESDDSYAAKAGLALNVAPSVDGSIRVLGLYSDSPTNSYWSTSEWSVQASYGQQFGPKVFASVGGQYWSDLNDGAAFASGQDMYSVEAAVDWQLVENFDIRTEVNYIKAEGLDGSVASFMWFRRSF